MNFLTKKISAMALIGLLAGSAVAAESVEKLEATKTTSEYFWKFRPLKQKDDKSDKKVQDPRIVYRFFDEDYTPGGFDYWYPDASKVKLPEESGYESEVAIEFDLVASDYSGGAVVLYNMLYNVAPYVSTGALEFYIKGAKGGEIATVGLVDDETRDGAKTVVRLPIKDYITISKEWQKVSIPLADFGLRGVFWDEKNRVEVPYKFDWEAVAEFRIEIKKADNPSFKVWVDDIFIKRDMYDAKTLVYEETWAELHRDEVIEAPPLDQTPKVNNIYTFFENDVPAGGFAYTYGGKTDWTIQNTTQPGVRVWGLYPDNGEYSGVSLSLGNTKTVNLTPYRRKKDGKWAAIGFWLKAAPNVSAAYIGLIDDESDGNKVQTKLTLGDYGKIENKWNYFMVPLKAFNTQGRYWDAEKKAEITAPMIWDAIQEIRFSTNKFENKVGDNDPVPLYIADLHVIDDMPGYIDQEEYWANFSSDLPDRMIMDVESDIQQKWEVSHGPKSKMSFEIVKSGKKELGKHSVEFSYKQADWADGIYDFAKNNAPAENRDWSKHWALRAWIYSESPFQSVTIQVADSGNELFVSNTGVRRGWHEVLVPFKSFTKFPYYQPPNAVQNGHFDLESVVNIDFKPVGEGSVGKFRVDNVQLTNVKELPKEIAPEFVNIALTGSMSKTVTEKIKDELFGINVALWDGDLLLPETIDRVKRVNHGVLRYPGGLRADEDHWHEILAAKDWMVDTDEIVDFAKATNTTLMITVNGGRGTKEDAAAWVEHVNIKRKANIKYWEIGNELYGNWHPNQMTGHDYGVMCREYALAMKAVDPTIKITAVWTLEGPWNKDVFKECAEYVDGVNVHHYPQTFGQENDFALLEAPNSLDNIMPGVKEQLEEYGVKGKEYEIWLTEWNSVDFNPGPQTLSLVNGLFVADYLGKLAVHNIDQASYWDVHNSITEEGGDYGYLSRVGAEDGDNVPRPSYWAFLMASDALRGSLKTCETGSTDVTCYVAKHDNGEKWMMLVNKMPETRADVTMKFKEFTGKAVKRVLDKTNERSGPVDETVTVGKKLTLPPHSVTTLKMLK